MKLRKVNAIENGRNISAKEKIAKIPNTDPNAPDKTPADDTRLFKLLLFTYL